MEIGYLRSFGVVFVSQTGFRGALALVFANVLREHGRRFARATVVRALSGRSSSPCEAPAASDSSRFGAASHPNCRTVFHFA
jgi:hypothetical protein